MLCYIDWAHLRTQIYPNTIKNVYLHCLQALLTEDRKSCRSLQCVQDPTNFVHKNITETSRCWPLQLCTLCTQLAGLLERTQSRRTRKVASNRTGCDEVRDSLDDVARALHTATSTMHECTYGNTCTVHCILSSSLMTQKQRPFLSRWEGMLRTLEKYCTGNCEKKLL